MIAHLSVCLIFPSFCPDYLGGTVIKLNDLPQLDDLFFPDGDGRMSSEPVFLDMPLKNLNPVFAGRVQLKLKTTTCVSSSK